MTATRASGRSAGSSSSGWETALGSTMTRTATGRASRVSSSSSTASWASNRRQVVLSLVDLARAVAVWGWEHEGALKFLADDSEARSVE